MGGLIAILLLLLSGFLGVSMTENQALSAQASIDVTPVATAETNSCAAPTSHDDVHDALAVAGDNFPSTLWTVSTTDDVYPFETTVTWLSNRLGAVAFLEYLHYDCGVTQQDIDQWVMPERFKTVFANFSSYEQTTHCQKNDIQLFEFSVVTTYGSNDHALYWVKQVSPTRVAAFNLILPDSYHAKQAVYAQKLFPELPTCLSES